MGVSPRTKQCIGGMVLKTGYPPIYGEVLHVLVQWEVSGVAGVCFVSLTRRWNWRLCESIWDGIWRVSWRLL